MDMLTAQKLASTGQLNNTELRRKIDEMTAKPRFLDREPSKYVSVTKGIEISPFGVYMRFRRLYVWFCDNLPQKECAIVTGDNRVVCDRSVFCVLRTLIDIGITPSATRASACRSIFNKIVGEAKDNAIPRSCFSHILIPSSDYVENELIRAIADSVYEPKERVLLEIRNEMPDTDESEIYALLGSPFDLDSFEELVYNLYKKASRDPNFRVTKRLGKLRNVVKYIKEIGVEDIQSYSTDCSVSPRGS